MDLTVLHRLHDSVEVFYREQPLFRYVYAPAVPPDEVPKPYFHPLRTLTGNAVTLARPHDHLWHMGLAMTSAHLSGQNFWGGPTYVRGQGYTNHADHGCIRHADWSAMRADREGIELVEQLLWVTHEGETWIEETRHITVVAGGIDPAHGYWTLDLAFSLTNVRGEELVFGSPTTEGRPAAGYGGLFWRGPRSFQHGTILAADGLGGPEVMEQAAPWLAYIGAHDGTGERSTLLFLDHPSNPRFPTAWFVRNDPYACVSYSFMFDREYVLPDRAELSLRYRIVLADGAWSRETIDEYIARTPAI